MSFHLASNNPYDEFIYYALKIASLLLSVLMGARQIAICIDWKIHLRCCRYSISISHVVCEKGIWS